MTTTFHKMHGLANDVIVLDLREQDFQINREVAKKMAHRHTGVGCDQIMVLRKPRTSQALAAFEIWNVDGEPAEQCGNGVRCLGLYLHNRGETPDRPFLLEGPVNTVTVECLGNDQVRVDMGMPDFTPGNVPVLIEPENGWYPLEIDHTVLNVGAVSMGNPHALVVVENVETANVADMGAAIGGHLAFPQGCNVGFVQILDRGNLRLRVYERGAAETQACGSGACAAMSILHRAGLVDDDINVSQNGGNLRISWTGGQKPVIMEGSATQVFIGTLE